MSDRRKITITIEMLAHQLGLDNILHVQMNHSVGSVDIYYSGDGARHIPEGGEVPRFPAMLPTLLKDVK